MDEFEQSNLEKETNDSHNICYQNSLVLVIKLAGRTTEIFSVGLHKTDKGLMA